MFTGLSHVSPNSLPEYENYLEYSTGGKIAGVFAMPPTAINSEAAFIAEPLQGYGGIYPLDNGYLKTAFRVDAQVRRRVHRRRGANRLLPHGRRVLGLPGAQQRRRHT